LAYPTYYRALFPDLRNKLTAAATAAKPRTVRTKVSGGLEVAARTYESGPPGAATREMEHIMNTTHNTKTKLLAKAVGVAAAAVATPALLLTGAGTAHACALPYIALPYTDGSSNKFFCPGPEASFEHGQYDRGFLDSRYGLVPDPGGSS
jgi:hypothetical protein